MRVSGEPNFPGRYKTSYGAISDGYGIEDIAAVDDQMVAPRRKVGGLQGDTSGFAKPPC